VRTTRRAAERRADVRRLFQASYEVWRRTGEPDWSHFAPEFEIRDHDLPDSSGHRGRDGWARWMADWGSAWEDWSLEDLELFEVDDDRIAHIFRIRARGRTSGVQIDRIDAMLWTYRGDRAVRVDYYANYRAGEGRPWEPAP
jgi:ketosteroid isomerase-like protein